MEKTLIIQFILTFINIDQFIRNGVLGERDQKFSAYIFAPVFIQTYIIAIIFYLANNGAFHIIKTIGNTLLGIRK